MTLATSGVGTDFEDVSAAIRQLFEHGSMPSEVAAAVQQAYAALYPEGKAPTPLAVRSSATAEDLPGASFAGQQETFLNVTGEQDVLQAVKRCWSSLWTPRVLAYRSRHEIDPATVSLAVVAQVMVPASAAGVLFTADPLTGARDEIAIDAAWGLGEAVVGGLVTPDHIIADKATGTIKQMAVAEKTVLTAAIPGGTRERAVAASKRGAQVLDAAQVAQLVRLGSAIEAHYHTPQDIEWCLAGNQFWIVQSRPITTLPPGPVRWESPVPGAKWMNDLQAAEWATEPLSPLGVTIFDTMIAARQREYPLQKSPWYALVNGWLYIRVDCHLFKMVGGPAWRSSRHAENQLNSHRPRFAFLLGVSEQEGALPTTLQQITIEELDKDQYPDTATLAKYRAEFMRAGGVSEQALLSEIAGRLPPPTGAPSPTPRPDRHHTPAGQPQPGPEAVAAPATITRRSPRR